MSGVMRNYTLVDVLQGIYSTATGATAGVSNSAPAATISLVGEADETVSASDSVAGLSAVSRGWGGGVYGEIGWS